MGSGQSNRFGISTVVAYLSLPALFKLVQDLQNFFNIFILFLLTQFLSVIQGFNEICYSNLRSLDAVALSVLIHVNAVTLI